MADGSDHRAFGPAVVVEQLMSATYAVVT